MRISLLTTVALAALSQTAFAQTPDAASTPAATSDQALPSGGGAKQVRQTNIRNMLEKSGFSEIQVVPTSFAIRAKDSDGNPVMLSISPDSFTEITDINNTTGGSTTGTATANTPSSSATFVSIAKGDDLSSKVIGLDIYNAKKQDIGQIKDIALNQNGRTQAYVVSVGGFLGMGERYVAVNSSAVKLSYNDSDKKWHASMNATEGALKSAPEFKYTER